MYMIILNTVRFEIKRISTKYNLQNVPLAKSCNHFKLI